MIRNGNRQRSQRGFTLAEILVTTAIFAVIMIAALAVYDKSNRTFKSSTEAADLQQATRIAFDKLVSDLRIAGFDYNRGGVPNLVNAPAWAASTNYPVNSQVDAGNGLLYTCTQSGISGGAPPPWGTTLGSITVDGTVKWRTDSNGAQYEQQDEQLEYIGQTAIAIRANFDYYSDSANADGLENYDVSKSKGNSEKINYTPMDPTTNTPIFPYVTTGNDEIVIYALRSADATKNTSKISFWADVTIPRSAYPPKGAEKMVTITGIDTTNDNPPYSLVRMTVNDADQATWTIDAAKATPIAENIRSLQFYYYKDFQGSQILSDATNTNFDTGYNADGSTFSTKDKTKNCGGNPCYTGAIGGDGQWDATNVGGTARYDNRTWRGQVSSIRVEVVGMGAAPEPGYNNANETITSIKGYKQYKLSSLVVPRNLGLTGFPEPSYAVPAPPTITGACVGHCDAPVLFWSPPVGGGPVYQYQIESDINANFATASTVIIGDPSATSAILSDDGTDPSVTHYYRMYAVNDNGRSIASDPPFSVKPLNTTQPNPISNLAVTTDQANQITLTWQAPAKNVSGKDTLSCTAGLTAPSASDIPSAELLKYKIWRGTSPSFDPTNNEGVLVLDTTDESQPGGAAGATLTWIDTGAVLAGRKKPNSRSAPAACTPYYYRIQAVDRCILNNSYNKSGNAKDSGSTLFPTGTITISGQAQNAAAPAAPANLAVDLANSACPFNAGTNCKIILTWNKVLADTAGNAVGIDVYRITRQRKKIMDPTFAADPTFTPQDVSGFSATGGSTASWTDTPTYKDASDGQPWYYRYTVAAKICTTYSAESNTADYPTLCTTNAIIVAPKANNVGTATGDSPASAWLFDYLDSIDVTNSGPNPITSVKFDVKTYPGGALFSTQTISTPGPYSLVWPNNGTDLQIYEVDITVKTAICTETRIKYVQDAKAANCALQLTATSSVSSSTSGSTTTSVVTYTIKNTGSEDIILNRTVAAPPLNAFTGTIDVTWKDPDGQHADMTFTSINYSSTADNFSTATSPTSRSIPTALTKITAGGSQTITLQFQYRKQDPNLAATPATKICIGYQLNSEANVTKHCNVVGQAGTTANPTSCD